MSDTRPLTERLQDDQSLHWRAGQRPLVEFYLAAHPELGDDSAGLLDLLNHEVLLREERGEAPGLAEYLGRFPHLAAPLHDLFEVHALLEAEAADTPTLVVPGCEALKKPGRALDDEPPALPGYAALGRIDAGGMGVVWRVRDLRFRRSLAVKVMKSWACHNPGLARRFVSEAQICGQLAHPFIVPVHAMGRLPDGRPYYAMKLVEGRTLAALLKERPAPAERRTGLVQIFGQVCQAMAFAHGQGVIHRDLKPENVMVGTHGEVQIMDWGLAKVLGGARPGFEEGAESTAAEPGDEETDRTRAGSVLGTASYMPPEQARGLVAEIDRQSDVFALGAILCQVLTGEPPYTGSQTEAVLFRATEADLGEALARLRGCGADPELIRLAERCLAPRKADRPADAGAVAAAVAAYLTGVEERLQQERLRREREQVQQAEERRRRKLWLGLAGTVLVVLLAGIAGTTLGLIRARQAGAAETEQRRIAEENERHADAQRKQAIEFRDKALGALRATTSEDVEKLIGEKGELGPNERAYLEAIAKRWQTFADQEGADEQSRALRGEGHARVANLWQRLGRRDKARGEFEQARNVQQELADQFPDVAAYQHDLAVTRGNYGVLLADLGERPEARGEYEQAQRIEQKLIERFPTVPDYQRSLALWHSNLGILLGNLGEREEARTELTQARDILLKLDAQTSELPKMQMELARTRCNLAVILNRLGQREEARDEYEKARDIQVKLAAQAPELPKVQMELARTRINFGSLLYDLGEWKEARNEWKQARDIQKKLVTQFPTVPVYKQYLAAIHNNLGTLLFNVGQSDEAREARIEYEQARDLRQKLADQFPAVPGYQVDLGQSCLNLGILLRDQNQPADSLPYLNKAIETLTAVHEKESRNVLAKQYLQNSHWYRATALERLDRYTESTKDWQKATELSPKPESPEFRTSRATSQARAGRVAEAVAEVAELSKAGEWNSDQWYTFACFYSVASAKATDKKQEYADRAMELLRKAVLAGWKNGAHMTWDPDLDPLREREDFKKLLADLPRGKEQGQK
jgi:tetratricopeptide (TPR) repeat protein